MLRISVKDFGAIGDGQVLETAMLQRAINALAADGGELVFPAGTYLSGALRLIDNLTIRLEKGAVLQASPDIAEHFHDARCQTDWLCHYFLYGKGIKNFRLMGEGVVDGSGAAYWEKEYLCGLPLGGLPSELPIIHYNVLKPRAKRPVLLYLENCSKIVLENVVLRNAACYTVWCVGCQEVSIRAVTIRNPRHGPNTDALDIDCCQKVEIDGCDIESGDDCIALKSDYHRCGRLHPCEKIHVEKCRLSSATCAIRVGYEGDAPIRNATFERLEMVDCRHGIDILSIVPVCPLKIDRGTPVDNLKFSRITMRNVGQAFFVWAGCEAPRTGYCGHIREVEFSDMTIEAVASSFVGSEAPGAISGVRFKNVTMHVANLPEIPPTTDFTRMPSHWGDWWKSGGIRLYQVCGIKLEQCAISCDQSGFHAVEC
ncbi:MAG: hypothetical protein J5654_02275 [Victivallales bacterium]|nr:hypothetical protein [Victivallales bacterium]